MPVFQHPSTPGRKVRLCGPPNTKLGFTLPHGDCKGQHAILVSEGVQCTNCGNLIGSARKEVNNECRHDS